MKRIALVGMPNTGKSTLFNRLTGGTARVANWPGLTVELASSRILLGGDMVQVFDLPGIYDLTGGAEDEQVAQRFLAEAHLDAVVLVLNACQLDRQLALALQLKALGAPLVLCLNMLDEAKRAGITIDVAALSQALDCPIELVSAKYGQGIPETKKAIQGMFVKTSHQMDFSNIPSASILHPQEHQLFKSCVHQPPTLNEGATAKLDRFVLHPWLGLPLFILMMLALFQLTYAIGTPLQDYLGEGLDWFKTHALLPATAGLPEFARGLIVSGVFDGISTVLTFAPIIFLFFCLMAIIEDSGYFARAAFMMDGVMSRMGLDGRGFVMLMMGFGCNVPAIMGTRVIRDHKARLLTMLTIPFSLCSARLQIFLFLSGALFSPTQAPWVVLSLYLASILIAMSTAVIFKSQFKSSEPFALELPPYRLPLFNHIWRRGWGEARDFLRLATTMIVIGVVLVWLLTNYPNPQHSYAEVIAKFFAPVLSPIGIESTLSIALIFGFVAKEVVLGALSVITGHEGAALASQLAHTLDPVSAYSFMLFSLIYVPCVSTIAAIKKESKSNAYTAFSLTWSLGLAWLVSFVFYQSARLLGF
ncbi:ferrous iron transport protein B [Chitinibacter bivalviorum]|uniref:Ferrous iron transport protein B n=1 Tax=Chitinibacter bivalviorum TaxID=2739434 RepID=A0A7H9BL60_9NEIS|nr:ferrous iron transport protein B [Chitinibacter bivalviorum]QLG88751.1 ferrous iron transport protein B [Chitinibacter bivalviorum]